MSNPSPPKVYPHKSFYMTAEDQQMLLFLVQHHKLNPSAVIRKLMVDACGQLKYKGDK